MKKNSTFAGQTPSWDFAGKYIPCCSSNSSVFAAKNAHVCRPFSPHTQNFRRADHQTHGPGRDFGARQLCQLRADAIAPPRRSVAGAGDAGRSLSAVERWDSDGMDFFRKVIRNVQRFLMECGDGDFTNGMWFRADLNDGMGWNGDRSVDRMDHWR